MNEQEFQKMMLDMVRAIGTAVRMRYPRVNHISMYTIGEDAGAVYIRAFRDEKDKEDEVFFEAHRCKDGTFRIGDTYYKADGSVHFVVRDEMEEAV